MKEIHNLLENMEPSDVLEQLASIIRKNLSHLDARARVDFVMGMIDESGTDKTASMVNLWLAECMDEGVDPTKMCQTLVDKVAQSRQLQAVAHPDILSLFDSWLDELEEEVIVFLQNNSGAGALEIVENLGLSKSGADFLIAKLKREKKIQWLWPGNKESPGTGGLRC